MNYLEFIYTTSMDFWHSSIIQLILSVLTVLCFIFYIRNIENRNNKKMLILNTIALFTVNIIIYLNFFEVIRQCLFIFTLFTIYTTATKKINYKNSLVITASYITIIEFSTTIIKESYFTNSLSNILLTHFNQNTVNIFILIMLIALIILMSHILEPAFSRYKDIPLKLYHVIILLLPVALYLFVRNTKFYLITEEINDFYLLICLHIIEIAICTVYLSLTLILARMVSSNIEINEHLKHELLLQKQEEQYKIKLEVIDAINHKYHDLKHFVQTNDIKDLEREIKPFETIIETGHNTLNILISEKIKECQNNSIEIVPYINAKDLHFISDLDLCSLFGNIIDNAIEATIKLTEDKRYIHIKVDKKDSFIIMNFENSYLEEPVIKDNIFLTSKKEEGHGIGSQNIRRIVEKYNGSLSYSFNDHICILNILIPSLEKAN
ncbi:MAG: GHKL domain-containing protein [Erysipelotrichaceae bacterium]